MELKVHKQFTNPYRISGVSTACGVVGVVGIGVVAGDGSCSRPDSNASRNEPPAHSSDTSHTSSSTTHVPQKRTMFGCSFSDSCACASRSTASVADQSIVLLPPPLEFALEFALPL